MEKEYITPDMEITVFETLDILDASIPKPDIGDDETEYDGD